MIYKRNTSENDRLASLTFLFVALSLLVKIVLKSISLTLIDIEKGDKSLRDYFNDATGENTYVCMFDLSQVFSMVLFTIALVMNAVRQVY